MLSILLKLIVTSAPAETVIVLILKAKLCATRFIVAADGVVAVDVVGAVVGVVAGAVTVIVTLATTGGSSGVWSLLMSSAERVWVPAATFFQV